MSDITVCTLTNPTLTETIGVFSQVHRNRFVWTHRAPELRLMIQGLTLPDRHGGVCAHAAMRRPATPQDLARLDGLIPLLEDPRHNLAANVAHQLLCAWSVQGTRDEAWRHRTETDGLTRALATLHPEIYAVLAENEIFGPNQVVITKLVVVEHRPA